jgi:hypothetical protein
VGSKVLVLALQDVPRNDVGRYDDAQRMQQKRPGLITISWTRPESDKVVKD